MEESIGWRAIVVGREVPEKFELAMNNLSMGWSPEGEPDYPMDIVLGLNREARLTRLELTVLHWMAPNRVDIKLGQGRSFLPLGYKMAKKAKYFEAGRIKFDPIKFGEDEVPRKFHRGRLEFRREEHQRRFRFIWLVLHSPHRANGKRQKLGVVELKIFGLKEEEEEAGLGKRRQLFGQSGGDFEESSEEEGEDLRGREAENGQRRWDDQRGRCSQLIGPVGNCFQDFGRIEEDLEAERGKARKEDKPFRAMLVEGAWQDLRACKGKMLELRSKRTIALARGHNEEAELLRMAMLHAADHFQRASQLDLLIENR